MWPPSATQVLCISSSCRLEMKIYIQFLPLSYWLHTRGPSRLAICYWLDSQIYSRIWKMFCQVQDWNHGTLERWARALINLLKNTMKIMKVSSVMHMFFHILVVVFPITNIDHQLTTVKSIVAKSKKCEMLWFSSYKQNWALFYTIETR